MYPFLQQTILLGLEIIHAKYDLYDLYDLQVMELLSQLPGGLAWQETNIMVQGDL